VQVAQKRKQAWERFPARALPHEERVPVVLWPSHPALEADTTTLLDESELADIESGRINEFRITPRPELG
jgi:hypothetical protein